MSVVMAVQEFANRLADLAADGDFEIKASPRMWRALLEHNARAARFRFDTFAGKDSVFVLQTITGAVTVHPPTGKAAKCPHEIPWDYCSVCPS
jgi:hypothetical protein